MCARGVNLEFALIARRRRSSEGVDWRARDLVEGDWVACDLNTLAVIQIIAGPPRRTSGISTAKPRDHRPVSRPAPVLCLGCRDEDLVPHPTEGCANSNRTASRPVGST